MASIETHDIQQHLIRTDLWSNTIKEQLRDHLMGQRWIDTLVDFPDGNTLHIPSIGDTIAMDYVEGEAVKYLPRDTGEWTFQITEYIQSGTSISNKAMQDSYYAERLKARFVPDQLRALAEHFEVHALAVSENGLAANASRTINGYAHRVAGGGTNGLLELEDFAYAKLALQKALVPMTNLVAIVPPEFEYTVNTLSNLVTIADNPRWEGIIESSMNPTGMRFLKNIYGFDVYTSNYLPDVNDNALLDKEGNAKNFSSADAKAGYFFSASGGDLLPWKAAWRQQPKTDYKYEMDFQEHRWVTTARYGVKEYRPENLVTIVANLDVL